MSKTNVFFDHGGQFGGKLVEVGDIQEGISVDPLDVLFIVADGGGQEEDALALILVLYAAQIRSFTGSGRLLSRSATKRRAAPSRLLDLALMSMSR